MWSPGYNLYTLLAGYSTKLFNRPASFALNVSNVFDKEYYRSGGVASGSWGDPRASIDAHDRLLARLESNAEATGRPLMDFTNGEILEMKLRLIAFAIDSGPLIAGCYAVSESSAISRPDWHAEAMSRSSSFKISPLVKFISGASLFPATVLLIMI